MAIKEDVNFETSLMTSPHLMSPFIVPS